MEKYLFCRWWSCFANVWFPYSLFLQAQLLSFYSPITSSVVLPDSRNDEECGTIRELTSSGTLSSFGKMGWGFYSLSVGLRQSLRGLPLSALHLTFSKSYM